MSEWADNPGIVTAITLLAIALITVLWKTASWYGSVNTKQTNFDKFMAEVGNDLKEIHDDIKRIFQAMPRPAAEGQSPVKLTDFGQTISEWASVADWAKDQAGSLVENARGKEEFEIFEDCGAHINHMFKHNLEFQKRVRAAAYQHATDVNNVKTVYQVELRDRILDLIEQQS